MGELMGCSNSRFCGTASGFCGTNASSELVHGSQRSQQVDSEVRKHMLLGISIEGIMDVLKCIDFPYRRFVYGHPATLQHTYQGSYSRPAHLDWVTEQYGEFSNNAETSQSTGYDVAECIRSWLTHMGCKNQSICEVWSTKASVDSQRLVGLANIFYSHVQSVHIGESIWTLMEIDLPDVENKLCWFDFFTLQQCAKHAFVLSEVVEVIGSIGRTICEVDNNETYFTRSFCMLEVYASVFKKSALTVSVTSTFMIRQPAAKLAKMLNVAQNIKVDSEKASCRNEEDKATIDKYIYDNVGFSKLNEVVRHAILQSMDSLFECGFDSRYEKTTEDQDSMPPVPQLIRCFEVNNLHVPQKQEDWIKLMEENGLTSTLRTGYEQHLSRER